MGFHLLIYSFHPYSAKVLAAKTKVVFMVLLSNGLVYHLLTHEKLDLVTVYRSILCDSHSSSSSTATTQFCVILLVL